MQFIGKQATTPSHSIIITPMKHTHGFTLIELMVTLTVVAITVAVGGPKISQLMQGNRYASTLNILSANITYTRSEAVKRNTTVSIASLNGDDAWQNGWRVFIDTNSDGVFDNGETELRVVDSVNLPNTTINLGANPGLTYNPIGVLTPTAAVVLQMAEYGTRNWNINISPLGSVSIAKHEE